MMRVVIKPRYGGNLEVHGDITGTPRLSERCGDRCRGLVQPHEVGDVLYVRETWAGLNENEYLYQADDPDVNVWKIWRDKGVGAKYERWMSPVTMPREAARLFLRVKDVRVERVQDISPEDCESEGYFETALVEPRPRSWFSDVWDAHNAKRWYGWDSNPWAWVIEFERVEKGVES